MHTISKALNLSYAYWLWIIKKLVSWNQLEILDNIFQWNSKYWPLNILIVNKILSVKFSSVEKQTFPTYKEIWYKDYRTRLTKTEKQDWQNFRTVIQNHFSLINSIYKVKCFDVNCHLSIIFSGLILQSCFFSLIYVELYNVY